MGNEYIQVCLNDLNGLEKEILKIALSDREKYCYFKDAIDRIKQAFLEDELDDDYGRKKSLITDIQNLSMEIEDYMEKISDSAEVKLTFGMDVISNSGNAKIKRHRIDIYKNILEVMKKGEVDIEKLKKVVRRWEEEKSRDLGYSAIEKDVIERMLADVLMEYQLEFVRKNNKLSEESIKEFCILDCYERSLRERLVQALELMDKGQFERLELEKLLIEGTLEEMVANATVWEVVTGVKIDLKDTEETKKELIEQEEEKNEEEEAFGAKNQKYKNKMLLIVRKNNIFGKEVEKKVYVKIKEEGRTYGEIDHRYRKNIIYAEIPEGVKYLPERLFEQCANLRLISLPDSLKKIGDCAFQGCDNLKRIKIPKNCRKIGSWAFQYAKELKEIDLSEAESLEEIEYQAFGNCNNLKRIKIPRNCREIGDFAFAGARRLEEIDLSEAGRLEEIGNSAFSSCDNLKRIKIPDGWEDLELFDFAKSKGIEVVVIKKSSEIVGKPILTQDTRAKKKEERFREII